MAITSDNIVPLPIALEWVHRWRNTPCEQREPHDLKGFWVPLLDIQEVLAEQGLSAVRTYFGIDGQGTAKQLIVAVDAAGNDMIDEQKGWYIYDLTQPCPPMCGRGPLS